MLLQQAACSGCPIEFKALYAGEFIGEAEIVHSGAEIEKLRVVLDRAPTAWQFGEDAGTQQVVQEPKKRGDPAHELSRLIGE